MTNPTFNTIVNKLRGQGAHSETLGQLIDAVAAMAGEATLRKFRQGDGGGFSLPAGQGPPPGAAPSGSPIDLGNAFAERGARILVTVGPGGLRSTSTVPGFLEGGLVEGQAAVNLLKAVLVDAARIAKSATGMGALAPTLTVEVDAGGEARVAKAASASAGERTERLARKALGR